MHTFQHHAKNSQAKLKPFHYQQLIISLCSFIHSYKEFYVLHKTPCSYIDIDSDWSAEFSVSIFESGIVFEHAVLYYLRNCQALSNDNACTLSLTRHKILWFEITVPLINK